MKKIIASIFFATLLVACAAPNRMVYSSGFSFANYDYMIMGKPETMATSTSLYGMDIEFSNLMSRYNMKIIGDKEYATLPLEAQKRSLYARMALVANGELNLVTVTFDDATTGKTGSSITAREKGDIFDNKHRSAVLESLSSTIIVALQRDKGLTISDDKK